jgi:hypothetical protein
MLLVQGAPELIRGLGPAGVFEVGVRDGRVPAQDRAVVVERAYVDMPPLDVRVDQSAAVAEAGQLVHREKTH